MSYPNTAPSPTWTGESEDPVKGKASQRCPHCDQPALCRTSQQITPLLRAVVWWCRNEDCGHEFLCHNEIVCTTHPPRSPNPKVKLPLSARVDRNLLRALLDNAPEAPQISRFTQPKKNVTGDLFAAPAAGGPPPD